MKVFTLRSFGKASREISSFSFGRRSPRIVLTLLMSMAVFLNTNAQFSLTTINTLYQQDFNTSLANSGTANAITTLPTGWTYLETGSNANTTYSGGTGSSTTGDTWSFGAAASNERALGQLRSGSLISTVGVVFTNNTNSVITNLSISYVGEQWRIGATRVTGTPVFDKMDFQYNVTGTNLTTGTFVDFNALDFLEPITTIATPVALDGNNAANRVAISGTITGLSIQPGGTFALRWTDVDATGADDGLAIDDFNLTATGSPSVTTDAVPAAIGTTTATLGGNISNDGNGIGVTGRGVVWSVTATNI